ncbi:MAG: hypothetical protein QOH12_1902 [Solirubrobacteraceae bacterium]|jgi:hypothetical protein|nr:hypothetical protein [Solirubrobacteraceae bacterium]
MAATARPKPVGLRFKPCFPLRFQRVDDPGLVGPVDDHGDPERTSLAAWLGDIHPPDRHRLERLDQMLDPVGQRKLGLGGQHDLAVDSCRQTTGVALGDPSHAHQSV